jgi:hypothetical protein
MFFSLGEDDVRSASLQTTKTTSSKSHSSSSKTSSQKRARAPVKSTKTSSVVLTKIYSVLKERMRCV